MPEEEFQQYAFKLGMTKARREAVEKFRKIQAKDHNRFCSLNDYSSPVEIYDLFSGIPFTTVVASLIDIGLEDERHFRSALDAFVKFKRKWETLNLELNGDDLIELGVPEGREVGTLLNELLHAKLAGSVTDRMSEIYFVRNKLNPEEENGPRPPEEGGASENAIPFS
jgi:tRNA nucleotidyltransferase (CCA-adding enzyme)